MRATMHENRIALIATWQSVGLWLPLALFLLGNICQAVAGEEFPSSALKWTRVPGVMLYKSGSINQDGQISGTLVRADNSEPVRQFKVFIRIPRGQTREENIRGFPCEYDTEGLSFETPDGSFTVLGLCAEDQVRVVIDAEGYRRKEINRVTVKPLADIEHENLIVRVWPATDAFGGIITDQDSGEGVSGVQVSLIDPGPNGLDWFIWSTYDDHYPPVRSATTDAEGRFRFDSVPMKRGAVVLEKKGFERMLLEEIDFHEVFEAKITRGAGISGTVTDEKHNPVPGVYLTVPKGKIRFGDVRTDQDGNFACTDLPPGRYVVRQHGEQGGWLRSREVIVEPGQNYTVEWEPVGPVVIEGVATLAGQPASGFEVSIHGVNRSQESALDKTGMDGRYQFSVAEPGEYRLSFQKGDWLDPNKIHSQQRVTLRPGNNQFDVSLPGASIAGRVTNRRTPKPVAGVAVVAFRKESDQDVFGVGSWTSQHLEPWWCYKKRAMTDQDGQFEMSNLAAGEWIIAQETVEKGSAEKSPLGIMSKYAEAIGRLLGEGEKEKTSVKRIQIPSSPFLLGQDEQKEDFVLAIPELGRCGVRVIDADSGEAIEVQALECVNEWGFKFLPETIEVEDSVTKRVRVQPKTQDDGSVIFDGLPPGEYRVFAGGSDVYPQGFAEFEVKEGTETDVILQLNRGGRIVFRLWEKVDDPMLGFPWIGFQIKDAADMTPVLEDARGPYWGTFVFLKGEPVREAFLPLPADEYSLEWILRRERQKGVIAAEEDLRRGSQIVTVEAGKDNVIKIPWK